MPLTPTPLAGGERIRLLAGAGGLPSSAYEVVLPRRAGTQGVVLSGAVRAGSSAVAAFSFRGLRGRRYAAVLTGADGRALASGLRWRASGAWERRRLRALVRTRGGPVYLTVARDRRAGRERFLVGAAAITATRP